MTNPPGAMPPLPEPSGIVRKGYKRTHIVPLEEVQHEEYVYSETKLQAYAAPLIARVAELKGLLEELVAHESQELEYDGCMLTICPECGEKDGSHRPTCAFVRARAAIAAKD